MAIPGAINALPVTSLGAYAFSSCTNLTSVNIPDSVTNIGIYAFWSCTKLTNVTIPPSVMSIADNLFDSCTSLTNVTIPNSVTSIGGGAFYSCTSLTNVTIPNSVTNIGNGAFGSCSGLTSVTIPNSLTKIGDSAFRACSNLGAITVDSLNTTYRSLDGVLFRKNQTTLIQYPGGKTGSYTVPNGVTSIGAAFSSSTKLTSVTIPDSVTSIDHGAFWYCTSLTSLTIPDSVTNIADYAFYFCTSLTNVTIPNSVTNITDHAFAYCTSLASVTVPNSVTSIGSSAFLSCTSLTSITIPKSVTSIGTYAFYLCTSLSAITVDALNSAYSSLDGVLFDKRQTTLLQCPAGKPGGYTVPNSVTSIGNFAFASSSKLTSVTIGSGVNIIGYDAFNGCASLTTVTVPKGVTSIGSYAFAACTDLVAITVEALNSAYSSLDGVLFNKSQTTLIQCPAGKTGSYTVPSSVTNIAMSAFDFCVRLARVNFQGNAPSVSSSEFLFNAVYYLPGTTGWGPTFGGHPTALWLPQVQTTDASFGVQTNQFGFNITWAGGQNIVVEASADLTNPTWIPLQTNTLTGDSLYFSDQVWTNYPTRFYRIRSQ